MNFRGGAIIFRGGAIIFRGGATIFRVGAIIFRGGAIIFRGGATIFRGSAIIFRGGATIFRCIQNDLRGDAHFPPPPKPGHHFIFLYRLRVHDPVHILNVLQLGAKTKNRAQCGFPMQSAILITQ